jgi:energy-coupling factor transporter ATP-binding protein EcfA2
VHLAKLLRSGGNLLLLDEPTNDLDVDTLRALEDALLAFPGCAVVISHDRWFLDRVATHVLAFEGDSQVTWFEGNFEAYEEHRHASCSARPPTGRTGSPTSGSSRQCLAQRGRVLRARAQQQRPVDVEQQKHPTILGRLSLRSPHDAK